VGKYDKLLNKILSGRSDGNIAFSDLMQLLLRLQFDLRIRGDHHIFTRHDIAEILNFQPVGSMTKPYQVKQVRQVLLKYQLGVIDE
jgi:hypothetical protein